MLGWTVLLLWADRKPQERRGCLDDHEPGHCGVDRKRHVRVAQRLRHILAFDEQADRGLVADLDRLAVVLARQKPAWEPGTRQAYHAITLGYYEGELLRRVDPKHRSLGQFFQDEIATPLGIDFYIRLPESIPDSRLATLASPGLVARLRGFPFRVTLTVLNPRANIVRALAGSMLSHDPQRIYARNFEVPAGGVSARRVPSRVPTACSRPADGSWGCARKRWPPWWHRRFRRPAASTTSA
ncbi:MAG: beta-lactamase family protein [Chromatiales bacterium]|nr:beta-lactamase family protein [Chromatiales bacterium]